MSLGLDAPILGIDSLFPRTCSMRFRSTSYTGVGGCGVDRRPFLGGAEILCRLPIKTVTIFALRAEQRSCTIGPNSASMSIWNLGAAVL
jgi:hypothetical protein